MILKLPITIASPLPVLRAWASELRGKSFLSESEVKFRDYELRHIGTEHQDPTEGDIYRATASPLRAYFARSSKVGSLVHFKAKFSIDFTDNLSGSITSFPTGLILSLPFPALISQVISQAPDVTEAAYNDSPAFLTGSVAAREFFSGLVSGSPYSSEQPLSAFVQDDSPPSFSEIAPGVEMRPRDNFMVGFTPAILTSLDMSSVTNFIYTISFVVHGFYETYEG